MDWVEKAVCRSVDPELWFPEASNYSSEAVRICATCPVQKECLTLAMESKAEFGIWGGVTASKRKKIITTYIKRGRQQRDRMILRLLDEIDELVEGQLEGFAKTRERMLAKKRSDAA